MGLLDWLSDIGGSSTGAGVPRFGYETTSGWDLAGADAAPIMRNSAMANADMTPHPDPVAPPQSSFGSQQPPIPYQSSGGLPPDMQVSPSGNPPAQVPLPTPRPDIAGGGGGPQPGPPLSIAPPPLLDAAPGIGAQPGMAPAGQGGLFRSLLGDGERGPLAVALGIDPNTARRLASGLAAGFKAAGDSAGKSKFQAFASGAGAALEGSNAGTDKTYDKKVKYLEKAIAAQQTGDKAEYNKNYTAYLATSLKNQTDKAARESAAWNKPDAERYNNAMKSLANDPFVHASLKSLESGMKDVFKPEDKKKLMDAHESVISRQRLEHLRGAGFDSKQIATFGGIKEGMVGNPYYVNDDKTFSKVQPGEHYINAKDGKIYVKRGDQKPTASAAPPAAVVPSIPTAPSVNPPGARPYVADEDRSDVD